MLRRIAEKVWWMMPYPFRIKLVRSFQQKFSASVVAIVTNEQGEILILDHFFRPRFSWGLPGGFLDANETPEQAIRRELREETSVELENISLLRVQTIGTHIEILFRATGKGEAKVSSQEIRDLGWYAFENLPEMSETQITLIENVLARE